MIRLAIACVCGVFVVTGNFNAQAPEGESHRPLPVPRTRPEMKQRLEELKSRVPRIPLPTDVEPVPDPSSARANDYETRLKRHYLDGEESPWRGAHTRGRTPALTRDAAGGTAAPDAEGLRPSSGATPNHAFSVELFWIVSRVNNCHYCLGHQETKLLAAGRSEERIASLDGDWGDFPAEERVAFEFARKLTYRPDLIGDEDVDALRSYYDDRQILEMLLSLAWNNSINRWKEGIGVPQRDDEGGYSRLRVAAGGPDSGSAGQERLPRGSFLTPTPEPFGDRISKVAPIALDPHAKLPSGLTAFRRPPLESFDEVERRLEACRRRVPRLRLPSGESWTAPGGHLDASGEPPHSPGPVWNWMRLIRSAPHDGEERLGRLLALESNRDLSPLSKAQLRWLVARQDRAWYVVGHALRELRELGQSDAEIASLDTLSSSENDPDRAIFRLAVTLSASPVMLTDDHVAEAVRLAGPARVTQAIRYVAHLAAFNRVTEAAGLPLEW